MEQLWGVRPAKFNFFLDHPNPLINIQKIKKGKFVIGETTVHACTYAGNHNDVGSARSASPVGESGRAAVVPDGSNAGVMFEV